MKQEIYDLIMDIKNILPPKVDYADVVGAPDFARGKCFVWNDPEPYLLEKAADMLEKLGAENELLKQQCRFGQRTVAEMVDELKLSDEDLKFILENSKKHRKPRRSKQ